MPSASARPRATVRARGTQTGAPKRLKALEDELNRYLAGEYGVKVERQGRLRKWLKSHQPFHWFIEFYGILNSGGFDVIIGIRRMW